jgi:hypothetical protein
LSGQNKTLHHNLISIMYLFRMFYFQKILESHLLANTLIKSRPLMELYIIIFDYISGIIGFRMLFFTQKQYNELLLKKNPLSNVM